jgi:hypothetical protein
MAAQALTPAAITGKDMVDFLDKDEKKHVDLMATAGFLLKK